MAQPCRVCTAPDRQAIELAIVQGDPLARIARAHGLSRKSVTGHRDKHLPDQLRVARAASDVDHGIDLLAELDLVHRAGMALLRAAITGRLTLPKGRDGRDRLDGLVPLTNDDDLEGFVLPNVALRAIREVRGTLELIARIEGEIEPEQQTIVVTFDDEWVTGQ